jgi:hypothetical protein
MCSVKCLGIEFCGYLRVKSAEKLNGSTIKYFVDCYYMDIRVNVLLANIFCFIFMLKCTFLFEKRNFIRTEII